MSISTETLVSRQEIMKGKVLHVTVDTVEIDDGQGGEKKPSAKPYGTSAPAPSCR